MEKLKYKLTEETKIVNGRTLYRIQALRDFNNVKKGDKGGWVEHEDNLSQLGNCWIYDEGKVYEDGELSDNATIHDTVEVYDSASAYENSKISGNTKIHGITEICGNTSIHNDVIYGLFDRIFISGK